MIGIVYNLQIDYKVVQMYLVSNRAEFRRHLGDLFKGLAPLGGFSAGHPAYHHFIIPIS